MWFFVFVFILVLGGWVILTAVFWLLEWIILGIGYIIECLFKGFD